MLVVDPRHWLDEDGDIPDIKGRLRRNIIRVAKMIEYGAELEVDAIRETLIACRKRPKRIPCPGLLFVTKMEDDAIFAFCPVCKGDQTIIHSWQETRWAQGLPNPVLSKSNDDGIVQ